MYEVQSIGIRERFEFWKAAELVAQNFSRKFGKAIIINPEKRIIVFIDGSIQESAVKNY